MMEGARKILEVCCGLRASERVTIVTDFAMGGRIAEVLAAACAERGAGPLGGWMTPRDVDGGGAAPPAGRAAPPPRAAPRARPGPGGAGTGPLRFPRGDVLGGRHPGGLP